MIAFLKKKDEKQKNKSFKDIIEESKLADSEEKKFQFSKHDIKYYNKLIKKIWNKNLIPLDSFLEKVEIILLNNKNKAWFNFKKALLYFDTEKYPVYKKLSFITELRFIDYFLNEEYKKYNFIFKNLTIDKSIHHVAKARAMRKLEKKYSAVTDWAMWWGNGAWASLVQFLVMWAFSTYVTFVPIMNQWMKYI